MSINDLRSFDMNLLLVFAQLFEHRSISIAAQKLKLTQPAASNALRRLRESLGDDLFVRTKRGIEPTPRAQRMAPEILAIVKSVQENVLKSSAEFSPQTSETRFRIATTDYSVVLLLPKICALLEKAKANISLDLVPLSERVPFADLDKGNVDLALGHFGKAPTSLQRKHLYQESYAGMIRAGHPLANKKIGLREFVELKHVFVAPWGNLGGPVDDVLRAKGLSRKVSYMVPSFSLAPEVISRTDCITSQPVRIIEHFSKTHPIKKFDLPIDLPNFSIALLWHKRTQKDRAFRWLRDLITEALAD